MGILRHNTLWGNDEAGLQVTEASEPLVQSNLFLRQGGPASLQEPLGRLHEQEMQAAKQAQEPPWKQREGIEGSPGIWVHSGGRGTLEGNEVTKSAFHGVVVGLNAAPLLRANSIHANRKAGAHFQDGAGGTLLDNEIHRNWVGVECCDDAQPVVRGNRIHHQKMGGVWVYKEVGSTSTTCPCSSSSALTLIRPVPGGRHLRGQ